MGWKAVGATLVTGALALSAVSGVSAQANLAPTAQPDHASTLEDTPVVVSVLPNDTDPNPGAVLNVTAVGKPVNGKVLNADKTVTYTPKANFNGVDFFTYTISDGALTASAMVVVTVVAVNDAPVAKPDAATLVVNTSKALDVLANDSDVEGSPLSLVAVTQPSHGTVAITPDKKIAYTPTANYTGSDSFTYTISDGQHTAAAVVSITVKAYGGSGSTVHQQVKSACGKWGLGSDVRTLCKVYVSGKLPAAAQSAVGQVILRRIAMPSRAAAICSTGGLDLSTQQLCSVYHDSSVSSSIRSAVGKIIERSVRR